MKNRTCQKESLSKMADAFKMRSKYQSNAPLTSNLDDRLNLDDIETEYF
jgi:hypothetical protein